MSRLTARWFCGVLAIIAGIVAVDGSTARAVNPDDIQTCIDRAKTYILSKQAKDGTWEIVPKRNPKSDDVAVEGGQFGGVTALMTYALLAGDQDPATLIKPIDFLKEADIVGTYARGFRAQVWLQLSERADSRAAAKRECGFLMGAMKPDGFYNYVGDAGLRIDHSNSQVAALGMWACAQILMEVPDSYWQKVDAAWRHAQLPDGGWDYGDGRDKPGVYFSTATMTAAGVATLFITQDQLNLDSLAKCNGNPKDDNIERGLQWMSDNFEKQLTIGRNAYMLYGVERIGAASGRKYLGAVDWFKIGSEWFVGSQRPDGSWYGGINPLVDTAFATLFLTHGRAPVAINKLDYSLPTDAASQAAISTPTTQPAAVAGAVDIPHWNERPRDVPKLVRWISHEIELGKPLNWQVVTLRPPVEELHDAPILYIAGNQPLNFTDVEMQKLHDFVEQGGLILFNADCDEKGFSDSVKELGARLFPMPGEFRDLPADHPIYTNEQFFPTQWKDHPKVMGLSNGVRELMILLSEGDPSHAWQRDAHVSSPESFQLGADIFLYSVDKKNLRYKGQTYIVTPNPGLATNKTIKVARLQYNGNWNPEPGGWKRLTAILRKEKSIELLAEPVKLGSGKLKNYSVAHLTGTGAFMLSNPAREELKNFIESGGTLIVDAAGGSADFAASTKTELGKIFPDAVAQLDAPLKPDHRLYADVRPELIVYRDFARKILHKQADEPRITGMTINGRVAVFLSAEDISGGLVGEPMDGIYGYDPATCTLLMTQMLLYADPRK